MMTTETYYKYHSGSLGRHKGKHEHKHCRIKENLGYVGKHEPKIYKVWIVAGPLGPVEEFTVSGWENAKNAVKGAYDYEITDMKGNVLL